MITDYIADKKNIVTNYLTSYLKTDILPILAPVNSWGKTSAEKLIDYSIQGKMIRAALVFLGHDMYKKNNTFDVTPIAAAIELFHSGFLIHDDIMDNDEMRRHNPAMHIQYKQTVEKYVSDPKKTGESLAIAVGDVSMYLGYYLLTHNSIPSSLKSKLLSICSQELANVAIAQIGDVYGGDMKEKIYSKDEIIQIYRYKTGRYTCALPLVAGAMAGGINNKDLNTLWEFGETLGIIYQLVDDNLNIFGNSEKTGKPLGSDIRDGKQTLLRFYLSKNCTPAEMKRINSFSGKQSLTSDDLTYVQSIIKSSGTLGEVNNEINSYLKILDRTINTLRINPHHKQILQELIQLLTDRSS